MKHILFIEDDSKIAAEVISQLEAEGYTVTHIKTLSQASAMNFSSFSLMILDWNLPDGESVDLLAKLRGQGVEIPALMLTARTGVNDRLQAQAKGGTDFLGKPFHFHELLARVSILTSEKNPGQFNGPMMTVGDFKVNKKERSISYKGHLLVLTKKEYDLLLFLASNPRTVFTRDEILDAVWGEDENPTNRTVDTHILQLRKKFDPTVIKTVWSTGYRFLPEGE